MSVTSDEFSCSPSSRASSSSPEPSSPLHYDLVSYFRPILELEGLPTDYDWSNADLASKAFSYGRRHLIKLFLEKGCRAIGHGTTNPTLHEAMTNITWSSVLVQLANLGATVADRNCKGDTALHLALVNDAADGRVFDCMLENYLDEATDNVTNSDGLSLLHIACAKATPDRVLQLLRRYPDDVNKQVAVRNRTPFSGYTPLHFAVLYGRYDVVAALLVMGKADLYAQDRLCTTPLHLALCCEDVDMLDLMLTHDDKYENCVNNFGLSHFMVACAGSRVSVVKKFLHVAQSKRQLPPSALVKFSVADSTKYPFAGYRPLHFAAENGNLDTVRLLLEAGASTCDITLEMCYTPLALARLNDYDDVCRLLQRYSDGCSETTTLVRRMENLEVDCTSLNVCGVLVDPPAGVAVVPSYYELF